MRGSRGLSGWPLVAAALALHAVPPAAASVVATMGRRRAQNTTSDDAGDTYSCEGANCVESCEGAPRCQGADLSGDELTSRANCEGLNTQFNMDCTYVVEAYEACAHPALAIVVTTLLCLIGSLVFVGVIVNLRETRKEQSMIAEHGETALAKVKNSWFHLANEEEDRSDRRINFLEVEYVVPLPDPKPKRAYVLVTKEFHAEYEATMETAEQSQAKLMAAKIAGDVVKVCHMTSIGIDARASHFLSDNGESYHHEGLGGSAQNSAAIAVVAGLLVVVPLFFTVYDCGAAFMGIFGPVILAAAILMCWMIPKKYALKLTDPDGDYEYLDAKEGKKRVITSKTQFPGAIQRAQQAVTDSAESWRNAPAAVASRVANPVSRPSRPQYDSEDEGDPEDAV